MNDFETYLQKSGEVGFVEEIDRSLLYASGLPEIRPGELVFFEDGGVGQVLSFSRERTEILSLFRGSVRVGQRLVRSGRFGEVPVGAELLGHTIDPFGQSADWSRPLPTPSPSPRPLEVAPLGIAGRRRITRPLETGVSLVDLIVPLGKGQRELIIGDRKTGKTSFLGQVLLTQARQGTICIYAAIGKRRVDIKNAEEFFRRQKIMDKMIIVAASSEEPAGVIVLAPFAAMAIAEYFRDQGRDVLLVFDDLLAHAKFYREVALLGRRFPGRSSYPGDIFYLHARLLERAGNFAHPARSGGEVSLTCLPVVETAQSDFTGYIQSNLMSMTDGHLFFDAALFAKGRRPAINPFLSVTRVGRQTQTPVAREINRDVTALLALYEKTQSLAHFGMGLSEGIKQTLDMGERLYNFFDQTAEETIPLAVQQVLLGLLWNDFWHGQAKEVVKADMQKLRVSYQGAEKIQRLFTETVQAATSYNHLLSLLRERRASFKALL